jgi:FkbM family methyltransferase
VALLDRYPPLGAAARARFGGSREPEIALLSRYVGPGDTVVDVGAHKGVWTWHLARRVGRGGRVLAFEPQPDLAAFLVRAFARTPQVTVETRALSDAAGEATLTVPVWGTTAMAGHATLEGSGRQGLTVPLVPLDDFDLAPTFVKVDVEGHEAAVLRGARRTVARHRPTLLLEIDRRGTDRAAQREQVVALVAEAGYRANYLGGDGALHPVDLPDILDPAVALDGGRAVYNFVFTAPD